MWKSFRNQAGDENTEYLIVGEENDIYGKEWGGENALKAYLSDTNADASIKWKLDFNGFYVGLSNIKFFTYISDEQRVVLLVDAENEEYTVLKGIE